MIASIGVGRHTAAVIASAVQAARAARVNAVEALRVE